MSSPVWLPTLVELSAFGGDPEAYLNHLFSIFKRDFITSKPTFQGKVVLHDGHDDGGRPHAFVHITTETSLETGNRELSLRRCERIAWVRAIIENSHDTAVLVWNKEQKTSRGWKMRTYLFLEAEDFLVILEERVKGNFMITAIYVDNPNQKRKHLKAHQKFQRENQQPQV